MRALGSLAAVLVALAIVMPGAAATRASRASVFTGYGFDACTAPSTKALQAWSASPYRALGIYLGGVDRACGDGNLSASWVATTLGMGWSLMPLYVGLQAPCVSQRLSKMSSTPATAAQQGTAAADDAVAKAEGFGIGPGAPIYFDMEGYAVDDAGCTKAVQSFVGAWDTELRAQGYVAGVYGSAASTIRDVAQLAQLPDDVWIGDWNGVESVFGDPHVSDTLWANHQRIHQYKGGHRETYGGVTIDIDSNVVDAAVVGGTIAAPAPPPAPVAGSVASGDGKATATWPEGALGSTSVVTLTPTSQPPSPNGYAVQLRVTDSITGADVSGFEAPVDIHLLVPPNGLTPEYSQDGTTWKPLTELASSTVPPDLDAGYTLDADGTVEIHTLVAGYFGLLPDTTPPSQPPAFSGRFVHGALRLSWGASTDNSGRIATYQVLFDGTAVASVPGTTRHATVRNFHPAAKTVYRIRAVDPSGILGKPTPPLVVAPSLKPAQLPKPVPHWAWTLFAHQHGHGARPKTAPKRPPAWYWRWAAWRLAPFRVVRQP